ncbi:MAG: homoserine kinase [Nitrospiria bacterium]
MDEICVFAPASVGNIGPGFDVLGMALSGMGDILFLRRSASPEIVIEEIRGDGGQLPYQADENTAGIAAKAVLDHLNIKEGVSLRLQKAIPGSGLGSSAASAVAGAYGTNRLFGGPLTKEALIPMAAIAESKVSGALFFDNIGPSMIGGITWSHPQTKEVVSLGWMDHAVIVIATPDFPLLTRDARSRLPSSVPMADFVSNMAYAAMMSWAVAKQDVIRFGRSIQDRVAEPARASLIKGFGEVKRAALSAGALGCSISGAGASMFAVVEGLTQGEAVADAMKAAFGRHDVLAQVCITRIDQAGARLVADDEHPLDAEGTAGLKADGGC